MESYFKWRGRIVETRGFKDTTSEITESTNLDSPGLTEIELTIREPESNLCPLYIC